VTFFEAYQFAAQETLARTERTRGGAQHAAYDIALNGTGDLVMTNLRNGSAGLVLQADLQGFISVREADQRLVAELRKAAGHPVELGLEPGRYVVTMAGADAVFVATIDLHAGDRTEVTKLQFHAEPLELARARGDDAPGVVLAPTPAVARLRVVPFSLGIVPLVGSGPGERLEKHVSLNLIADRAARVRGTQLSVGINWADEEMRGFQAAIAANVVSGPVSGMQASVGGNYARGDVHAFQAAVGTNLAPANVTGVQAAAGFNLAGGDLTGAQMSAGVNWLWGNGRGLQMGAAVNWAARDFRGAQLTSGFNGVGGEVRGLQLGLVNYGGEVAGAQIGIVNIAGTSRALQLGLVNYADDDQGAPIGLVSYARRNGMVHLQLYGSETSPANVGLTIGGRVLYTTFAAGARPGREDNRYVTSLAMGARARVERPWLSFLDTELAATNLHHTVGSDGDDHLKLVSSLRLLGGWTLARRFSIHAGPSLNVLVRERGQDTDIAPGAVEVVLHDGAHPVSLYPGFVLGVEI
jgi:hypothetical protein